MGFKGGIWLLGGGEEKAENKNSLLTILTSVWYLAGQCVLGHIYKIEEKITGSKTKLKSLLGVTALSMSCSTLQANKISKYCTLKINYTKNICITFK